MTKGKYMAQSKGHWTSEDPETMGEAREGCVEEEACGVLKPSQGLGDQKGLGRRAFWAKKKRNTIFTQSLIENLGMVLT